MVRGRGTWGQRGGREPGEDDQHCVSSQSIGSFASSVLLNRDGDRLLHGEVGACEQSNLLQNIKFCFFQDRGCQVLWHPALLTCTNCCCPLAAVARTCAGTSLSFNE